MSMQNLPFFFNILSEEGFLELFASHPGICFVLQGLVQEVLENALNEGFVSHGNMRESGKTSHLFK